MYLSTPYTTTKLELGRSRTKAAQGQRGNSVEMEFRYTFWSSVSTVSANSLHEAVVSDLQVVNQFSEFIGKLNKVWSSSQQSVRKIPANGAVGVSRLVLERLEEELGSRVVDTGPLFELRKQYEMLLAESKETKKKDASLMTELKQWKGLKAKLLVQELVEGEVAPQESVSIGNGLLRFEKKEDMLAFLEEKIKKDIQYSRRFIPISGMANEYFTGMQLIQAVKKWSPDSVSSMYQQERLGQWLMDEGYMLHHNDILRLRKTFSMNGYYCWQLDGARSRVAHGAGRSQEPVLSRSEACNVMWEQWSKYCIRKLEFETWHMECMRKLGELRERLVEVVNRYEDELVGAGEATGEAAKTPRISMRSLYAKNMGSIGFYVTMNEPLVRPGPGSGLGPANGMQIQTQTQDSVVPLEMPEDVENSVFWLVLESLETEDPSDVRKWWESEFELVHWHRLREDIHRKWWNNGSAGEDSQREDVSVLASFLKQLPLEKRVCTAKGVLIELADSIVPGSVVERSLREDQDLHTSFAQSKVKRGTVRAVERLVKHMRWVREAGASPLPEALPEVGKASVRIPLVHFFMRCQHQVPQKLDRLEQLWWECVSREEELEAMPLASPVPSLTVTRGRSQSDASSGDGASTSASASVSTIALPVSPKRGHVTDTQFIPKPFKASRDRSTSTSESVTSGTSPATSSGVAPGTSSGSSGTTSREKRRSGTPLVHILQ